MAKKKKKRIFVVVVFSAVVLKVDFVESEPSKEELAWAFEWRREKTTALMKSSLLNIYKIWESKSVIVQT